MTIYTVDSDWVVINAPQRLVWNILVDFETYPQWNSFTTKVHTDLTIDSPVELHVNLPKRGKRIQHEVVRTVQPPHTLAWGGSMGANFLLTALRTQTIEKINPKQCRYRSTDVLTGALTPLVK
ncbi:MAG: SRPBCC domain-containing protein, partial [Ketobacter sp.]